MNGNAKYLTDKLFMNICDAYPDVFDLNYLLTGEGCLLTPREESHIEELNRFEEINYQRELIDSLKARIVDKEKEIADKDLQIEDLRLTIQLLRKRIDNAERWGTTQANFYGRMVADDLPEPAPDK